MVESEEQQTEAQEATDNEQKGRETLDKDLDELQSEYKDLKATLQRTHADFQNYKKRVQERQETQKKQVLRSLMKDLLPYLDNQELLLNQEADAETLRESLANNQDQLLDILKDYGLEPIPEQKGFDPSIHEAVLTEPVEDEEKHNTVQSHLRTGYKLGEHILRHEQVKIARHEE